MDIKEAKRIINSHANQAHNKYITAGFGMVLVFNEKALEAADYIAAGYPEDLSLWPFIKAECDALLISPTDAADSIIQEKTDWVAFATLIEFYRHKSFRLLSEDNVDIEAIVENTIDEINNI